MSHTYHHRARRHCGWFTPSSWRKEGNRAYRARWRQLMREGEFILLGHPRRDQRGWNW